MSFAKKITAFLLAFCLALSLCACGQEETPATWQGQYDLGVRYLSEGKYEEAILAFNAAIEIDPKQEKAYLSLSEVYVALGDTEMAIATLDRAAAALGETQLIAEARASLSVQTGVENSALPLNAYGATQFEYREGYEDISTFSTSDLNWLENLVSAVKAGDTAALRAMPSDGHFICTVWNGYKVRASSYEDGHAFFELRPENGVGYICSVYRVAEEGHWNYYDVVEIITCPCVDWQWNGEMTATEYYESLWEDAELGTCHHISNKTAVGTVVNGLCDGSFTITERYVDDWEPWDDDEGTSVTTRLFQNGVLLEQDGEAWEQEYGTENVYWTIGEYDSGGLIYDLKDEEERSDYLEELYW